MGSKAYFDQVANQWDNMRKDFFSEAVRDKALFTANVKKGQFAADIGAGSGFISQALIEKGLKVIAIDQSETMLEEMRKKFANYREISYLVGNSDNLPIQDNTVDYSFANMYLHHVESPILAIKEMIRILKPRGTVVITDLDEHNFEFLRTEQYDRWMGFKREDIRKWFEEAGLKNIVVDCVGQNCCAESNCGCGNANISIFIASGEKQI